MMKNKYSILIVLALGIWMITSCSNKVKESGWDVTIRGKVGFPAATGDITIQELSSSDSAFSGVITLKDDYTFEKTLHLIEPGYYRISFYDIQYIDFILDKSDLEINVDGNNPEGFAEVNGSPDHDLMLEVQTFMQRRQSGPAVQALQQEFQVAAANNDTEKIFELQEKYMDIMNETADSLAIMLRNQPVSLAILNMLQQNALDKDRYFYFYEEFAERMQKEWPDSKLTIEFTDMVKKSRTTAIGQKAPEISLPDPNGQIVKLSSFQGKYVLVDFWAKWCGPCRQENPNVVAAYNKYNGAGFEVLGVSLDRSKEDWLLAIEQDGLRWTQVSDLKYYNSQAAADYNINAIPFSILVDPQGVIIAKNLRGSKLDKKLEEIFGKKI